MQKKSYILFFILHFCIGAVYSSAVHYNNQVNPQKNRTQPVSQFIDGYLTEITNLNQLNYVFEIRKLGANGETFIKNQFKDLFIAKETEIFETIWNNTELRGSLFDLSDTATKTPVEQFSDMISNTSSNFYDFIKVE